MGIEAIIAGVVAVIAAIAGAFWKGRNSGKKVEQAKAVQKELMQEKAHNERIQEANDIQRDIRGLPDSDVEQRLRDKYQRD